MKFGFPKYKLAALLIFLLAFRIFFGLSMPFYGPGEIDRDALQTYLIGLKSYTTGTWPYFGPDEYRMDTGFHAQIPGALEGSVIAAAFYLLPIPEAPVMLLNLLSFAGLVLLSLWIARRLPGVSFPFILAWSSLLPWTLQHSTHVFNVSFLLFGSCLFFTGFLESIRPWSTGWLGPKTSFALMGFGIFWDMQFHNSWVLLVPFVLASFYIKFKKTEGGFWAAMGAFSAGAAIPLSFLVPTLLKYGIQKETTGFSGVWLDFYGENFKSFFIILARFLSLACFEMPRFLGSNTKDRIEFLEKIPWVIPPVLFLTLVGWLQPLALLICGWFRDRARPEAVLFQKMLFATLLWIWVCFWFTTTGPAAHMYYLFLPLVLVLSFYVWSRWALRKAWRVFGVVCIFASLWAHTGMALEMAGERSIYTDRDRIVRAIQAKDYRILWERRKWALY